MNRIHSLLATALLGMASIAIPGTALAQPAPAAAPSADARLKALADAEWAWRTDVMHLTEASLKQSKRMPDVDPATQKIRLDYWSKALATLGTIPMADLSPDNRITAAVLRTALEAFVSQIRYREYEEDFGFWTWMAPTGGFATAAEYRLYIDRLRDMPRYNDQQIVNLRSGLKRGFTLANAAIVGREATIASLAASDISANSLYKPFLMMPAGISDADRTALAAEGAAAVKAVAPSFVKLQAFIRDEYIPGARKTIAAEALPDGKAWYQSKIHEHTTLDLTADQIHAIGLKEVARIDADMQATMKKAGWTGDFAGFLNFMKTDPQFYAKTPYELVARSTYIANRAYGQLKFTIGRLPRYRTTILPTPDAMAPFSAAGWGALDFCLMNTYNLPSRPLYNLPALTLHECVPGHSFQFALALEGPDRPTIRQETYFAGYSEGWGLYTEWLGIGMGMYTTPYEEFGRETFEMWRACRLVIDTGMHHMGWTRQQAIDYLAGHTALSLHDVTTEVDRYINQPGQALAYKLGEMTIRRERAKAEAALGPKFDQRFFHDKLLGIGAVPLPVLEQQLDEWIADGGKDPYARTAS